MAVVAQQLSSEVYLSSVVGKSNRRFVQAFREGQVGTRDQVMLILVYARDETHLLLFRADDGVLCESLGQAVSEPSIPA